MKNAEAPQEATRLGSYEIVRKLARGGMAELFLARTVGPEGFAKLVVLKKILPNYAANPKFVRLFLDEAKLVAQMDHPHIAHVYDMGKAGNDYFFTMEYVHGQDIRAIWRRALRLQRPVPLAHAVQVARNTASALHYAHIRTRADGSLLDIVHRDVSPSNILISYEGAVKLVDFGVAKAATSSVKTRTGALKGKISYMSPEQAKGAPIDRRSDLYSLGIVLWELITGARLYKAENDLATIQMIINSKPPPASRQRPECPAALDTIIARLLTADVASRYQTAEQLQLDLEALAHENRWDQSGPALKAYMHELFGEELRVWYEANEKGQTLTEHIVSAPSHLSVESDVSEDEVEDEVDDILEDESEAGSLADSEVLTSAISTEPGAAPAPPAPPILPSNPVSPPTTKLPAMDDEATQFPTRKLQITPPTIQLSVPPPPERPQSNPSYAADYDPLAHVPDLSRPVDDAPTEHMLPPIHQIGDPNATPFPVAPAEWRIASEPAPASRASHEAVTKHVLIACSVMIAIITLFAIAFGGGTRTRPFEQRNQSETTPGPKVEMDTVPTER